MTIYMITLTITAYLATDHPRFHCFLCSTVGANHESKVIDINTANHLMWELKRKGWETKTTTHYNPYTSRVYEREIRWIHIDNGFRGD